MNDQTDENKLIAQRREKLQQMREDGNAFPNDFRRNTMAGELHAEYDEKSDEELEALGLRVSLAGRMMSRRVMGKASFAHLQDMSGRMQLFVQRDSLEGASTTSSSRSGTSATSSAPRVSCSRPRPASCR